MSKVIIYSTPTCHFCKEAKAFLEGKGVPYTEHNVAQDAEKREEMISISKGRMVPVIAVGDSVYVGFDNFKEAVDKGSVVL